ncbi:MAG: hypothetical protein ACYCY5_10415 [Sulfuricella sp.]
MRNTIIPFITIGFLLLGTPAVAEQAAAAAATPISEEASQALNKAEADVKQAKAKGSLWTTTAGDLKKAKEAAAKGDSAATLKLSKTVSEQAHLSLEQLNYPLTK